MPQRDFCIPGARHGLRTRIRVVAGLFAAVALLLHLARRRCGRRCHRREVVRQGVLDLAILMSAHSFAL